MGSKLETNSRSTIMVTGTRGTQARLPPSVLHFHAGSTRFPVRLALWSECTHRTTRRGSLKEGWCTVLRPARTGRAGKGQALTTLPKGPHCRTRCIISHTKYCAQSKSADCIEVIGWSSLLECFLSLCIRSPRAKNGENRHTPH